MRSPPTSTARSPRPPRRRRTAGPELAHAAGAPGATAVDSAPKAREQDLRHLRAGGDTAQRPLPGPPTRPAHPQPVTPASAVQAPRCRRWHRRDDDRFDIAGSLLAISGITGLTARSHRRQRQRATG
jgi:hypothetical protein